MTTRTGGIDVVRWQDPSGARLVIGLTRDGAVADLLPSFDGTLRTRLRDVRLVNDEVAIADVLDAGGEQVTSMAVEIEQRRLLPAQPINADATVVALGGAVTVYTSDEEFRLSDDSLLDPGSTDSEPPEHFAERGWPWPPRMAAESFLSYGVFSEPLEAEAYARLSGTVLTSERRTVAETGQQVIVAAVRTAGFGVTMCLDARDHPDPPAVGSIVSGTVFLTASLVDWAEPTIG